MKHGIYVVYDVKVEAYHKPFYARTDEEAKRLIAEAALDEKTNLNKYPRDYTLISIGTFDEEKGLVKGERQLELGNVLNIATEYARSTTLKQEMESLDHNLLKSD